MFSWQIWRQWVGKKRMFTLRRDGCFPTMAGTSGGKVCFVSERKQRLYEHTTGAEKKRRRKPLRVAGEAGLPGRLFYSM